MSLFFAPARLARVCLVATFGCSPQAEPASETSGPSSTTANALATGAATFTSGAVTSARAGDSALGSASGGALSSATLALPATGSVAPATATTASAQAASGSISATASGAGGQGDGANAAGSGAGGVEQGSSGLGGSGSGGSGLGGSGLGGTSGGSAGSESDGGEAGGSAAGNAASGGQMNGPEDPNVDPKFLVFLLLGQSNMEGAPQPESQDRAEDPRIKVLAYDDCTGVNREYGKWYTAAPPLHSCGAGVGPGDYFARTLLESLPDDYSIGLVPCGVNGAPIDLFLKGVPRTGYDLPPDNHWETGYEWIISRALEAQKTGQIAGILFHQGESNNEQPDWGDKVQGFVSDLRMDLALGDVPFLAGELYYNGAGAGHNPLIRALPDNITNSFVISAEGLIGTDQWHFDLASQRQLGTRYGEKMQELLSLP